MSYLIGDVEMQGTQPIDAHNVIPAAFTPKVVDGGKARIKRQRDMKFRLLDVPTRDIADDLLMGHVDTAPSEYCAPAWDPA